MRTLRRRTMAKSVGMKYKSLKGGGYDLKGSTGNGFWGVGNPYFGVDDKEFSALLKLNKK